MLGKLWDRTVNIATMYTGTFIVVMLLNQLLFFGFCLNPICLVAAMPHVLFITAVVGSWINKENSWGDSSQKFKKTAQAETVFGNAAKTAQAKTISGNAAVYTHLIDKTMDLFEGTSVFLTKEELSLAEDQAIAMVEEAAAQDKELSLPEALVAVKAIMLAAKSAKESVK